MPPDDRAGLGDDVAGIGDSPARHAGRLTADIDHLAATHRLDERRGQRRRSVGGDGLPNHPGAVLGPHGDTLDFDQHAVVGEVWHGNGGRRRGGADGQAGGHGRRVVLVEGEDLQALGISFLHALQRLGVGGFAAGGDKLGAFLDPQILPADLQPDPAVGSGDKDIHEEKYKL